LIQTEQSCVLPCVLVPAGAVLSFQLVGAKSRQRYFRF
jgi:hypothetical protein